MGGARWLVVLDRTRFAGSGRGRRGYVIAF